MKVNFTQKYLNSIPITGKKHWITDIKCANLRLLIGASGTKSYFVSFRKNDKKQSYKLCSADLITPDEARSMARDFLARLARGEEPEKKTKDKLQFGEFIEKYYGPWVKANRKTGKETYAILTSSFQFLLKTPVEDIKKYDIEQWQSKRRDEGSKAATVNRLVTALKAALNWGVDNEILDFNPLSRQKRLQELDSIKKVRYLSPDEKSRLMAAMDAREDRLRSERQSHNEWMAARGKNTLPPIDNDFADYLKPMVIISLNSGIRRGSLFALKWGDVDFETKTLTLRAATMKSGKHLDLKMNKKFITTLTIWHQQSNDTSPESYIFPSPKKKGALLTGVKRSWEGVLKAAGINNFRWHDMRHDFASQLVMKGVDLNTVRDLLGHADMKMTLRYAHLAPESKLRAVELLDDDE